MYAGVLSALVLLCTCVYNNMSNSFQYTTGEESRLFIVTVLCSFPSFVENVALPRVGCVQHSSAHYDNCQFTLSLLVNKIWTGVSIHGVCRQVGQFDGLYKSYPTCTHTLNVPLILCLAIKVCLQAVAVCAAVMALVNGICQSSLYLTFLS